MLAAGHEPRAVCVASYAVIAPTDRELVTACLAGDEDAAGSISKSIAGPFAIYSSAKQALARWVRRHAVTDEWAGHGVALNAIAPGIVRTPMTAELLADDKQSAFLQRAVPMPYGGVAESGAIADLPTFLTSESTRALTGQTVFVDGGAECVMRGDDIF